MKKIKMKFTKDHIALSLILILSAVLNFTNLSVEDYANEYYAAGVKSMIKSFKNFFFVAFDPSGYVTIDKPPLGFWMQAISAKIFGYHGWSIILPQAIAGVISVAILFSLVKRYFGAKPAMLSALCLAVTPIFVAASRNNTIDNQLVMVLLISAHFLFKSLESGKIKHIILSLLFVGIGFNIKMFQAFFIAPAIYFTYFIASKIKWKKKIINLVISTVVLLVVSFSWAIVVDLIPASYRPYVGSSSNNSELQLIFGHNALDRFTSSNGAGGGMGKGNHGSGEMPGGNSTSNQQNMPNGFSNDNSTEQNNGTDSSTITDDNNNDSSSTTQSIEASNLSQKTVTSSSSDMGQGGGPGNMPSGGKGGRPGNMPSGDQGGGPGNMPGGSSNSKNNKSGNGRMGSSFGASNAAGITRLFTSSGLSDQIMWLLPLALFGFIVAAMKEKLFRHFDNGKKLSLVFWLAYLVPQFIFFSYTEGTFHPYYLTMLSAPIAALVGIGMKYMWEYCKENSWKSFFLPVALLVDAALEIYVLSEFYSTSNITKILSVAVGILCVISSVVLIVNKIINITHKEADKNPKLIKRVLAVGLTGLLITPTFWSGTTLFYKMSGTFPSAGISLVTGEGNGMDKMGSGSDNSTSKLISFLKANKTNEKYLLVTLSASGDASKIIINTNESVMALGGFTGSDNILTLSEFKKLVKKGEIRYVMVEGGRGGMQGQSSQSSDSSDISSSADKSSSTKNGNSDSNQEIMNWVKENGKLVDSSKYSDSTSSNSDTNTNSIKNSNSNDKSTNSNNSNQFGGGMRSGQLYDLKESLN